jgi:hypothetical protein
MVWARLRPPPKSSKIPQGQGKAIKDIRSVTVTGKASVNHQEAI